ncbi:Prkrir [Cordylochernes scorpioides]|uniref:Prkrir n=1 Tax=Cordylochernes scorpioides TaxID=51811 RepID=A0ABY6L7D4_9ARAC|nr:Prkrir [Cordylochernes scorpioides]
MPGHKPMKDRLTLLLCANAKLVEEEDQELTTNELIDLHREQHQEGKEVISSGEEEDENSLGSLPSDQIREICKMWEAVQFFVAKHHPNKPAALRATDQFNDNAMSHIREILKKRQKQQSLDHYAFAYYLKKNNQCIIFEENQRDLETATEKISEYLERDLSSQNYGKQNEIDFALVSETWLKPCHKMRIQNFITLRNDRLTRQGGGTAIFIHKKYSHAPIHATTSNLETTGISIKTKNGLNMNLYSCYKPPNTYLDQTDIYNIFSTDTPTIIAEDLNCKHPAWGSTTTNPSGRRLQNAINVMDLDVSYPDQPTHDSPPDIIDIAFSLGLVWSVGQHICLSTLLPSACSWAQNIPAYINPADVKEGRCPIRDCHNQYAYESLLMKPYLNPEEHLEENPDGDSPNFQEEDIPIERTQQPQTRKEISGPITRSRAMRLRIYAFAYYLKKNNQCIIFEENQRDLETATEKISEYLERDLSVEENSAIINMVKNIANYCENRHEKLIEHVNEGYARELWEFNE